MKNNSESPIPEDKLSTKVNDESTETNEAGVTAELVASRFQQLEQLAGTIYKKEGSKIVLAGVEFDINDINYELKNNVQVLEQRIRTVLKQTARLAYKTTRALAIAGVLTTGYIAADFDRQEGFSFKDEAKRELREKGIPDDQRYSAYKPGISEMLYRIVEPRGYQEYVSEGGVAPGTLRWLEKTWITKRRDGAGSYA